MYRKPGDNKGEDVQTSVLKSYMYAFGEKSPKVEENPPATITCDIDRTAAQWPIRGSIISGPVVIGSIWKTNSPLSIYCT